MTHTTDDGQLQRRNRELSILNSIAQALNRMVDLQAMLQTVLAQVAELLNLRTGWIWLLAEHSGEPFLAASQDLPPALQDSPQSMEGSCYCLDTYQAGDMEGAANVNVITCSRLQDLVSGTGGLRYHASIPLNAHDQQLGVLNVASTDWRQLSEDDLRLLHTVGDLLAIAVERAYLFDRSAQIGAIEERNRLAREIHDTLAQGLTGIALQLESADALLSSGADSQTIRQHIDKALALAQANLQEARRSVLDLRAAPLEGRTLSEAIVDLADKWRLETGIRVEVQISGGQRPLPVRIEAGLYRIIQEALTNIARHADATHVELQMQVAPKTIRLVVEDNGRGFRPDDAGSEGFGLVGLNERARLLGGTLTIESSPGAGTRLLVRLTHPSGRWS